MFFHDSHNVMVELDEQADDLVVHWGSDVLAILYNDLLELFIPCISLTNGESCLSSFLIQSVDLVGQAVFLCLGLLELLLKLANCDCRIRTGRFQLLTIWSANGC